MNKFILLLACSAIIFCLSCTKEVVDAKKTQNKTDINTEKHRFQAEKNIHSTLFKKETQYLKTFGFEKLTGKCDCFYKIIKGTAYDNEQPFTDLEIYGSTPGRCDGNPNTPDCLYFSGIFSDNPNGACGVPINQNCTDIYPVLFPSGAQSFNCSIDKGTAFSVIATGVANSADCTQYSFLDNAKVTMQIICANQMPDECTRGGGGYSIASPPFSLYIENSSYANQDIFLDCECEPVLMN